MRILGAGFQKTGTASLHQALTLLGFNSIHFDHVRLNDIINGYSRSPNFRRYDDVDAVSDFPTALFYRELLEAYPGLLVVLTVRSEDDWWASARNHQLRAAPVLKKNLVLDTLVSNILYMAYGTVEPREFIYRKRYQEHNEQVASTVPTSQLFVMDITAGDGWEQLCPFLDVPVPDGSFPHKNRTEEWI